MKKRLMAMALALSMVVSMVPAVFATDDSTGSVLTVGGENGYATLTDAFKEAKAGDTVQIMEGTYALANPKAGVTVEGIGDVLLEGTLSGTLENITMKNLHIKGGNAQRWAYAKGDLVFENVTFEATSVYALHFDGITAGATLLYKDCDIIGWAAMSGSPKSCVFDGCTIKGNGYYGLIRTYFDATIENCTFDVDNVNTEDVYQDGIHAVSGAIVTVENCTNVNGDMEDIINISGDSIIMVDGMQALPVPVAKIGDEFFADWDSAIEANGGEKFTAETDAVFYADPSAYLDDGYTATKINGIYTVSKVKVNEESGAVVIPPVEITTPEDVDITDEIQNVIENIVENQEQAVITTGDAETDAAIIQDIQNAVESKPVEDIIADLPAEKQAEIENILGGTDGVTINVDETAPIGYNIDIQEVVVTEGEESVKLDITPMVSATAEKGGQSVPVSIPAEVNKPVVVSVPGFNFFEDGTVLKITHIKDADTQYTYVGTVIGGCVVFTNPNGFSEFHFEELTVEQALTEHYVEALAFALSKYADYIPTVQEYLAQAAAAADTAADYVAALDVPAQLADTKAALVAELAQVAKDMADLNAALENKDVEEIIALTASIDTHVENVEALADALGIVGDTALEQLYTASANVADWADEMAVAAYEWIIDTDANFEAAYNAFVADVVAAVEEISPELAALVEAYLMNTPAAAMSIVAQYGEDAYEQFISVSVAALSEDINEFVAAISAIIELTEVEDLIAVIENEYVVAAKAAVDMAKEKYEEIMAMYVVDALAYAESLNIAEAELIDAQNALVGVIIAELQANVDPAVSAAAVEAWNALCDLAADAAAVGGAYADFVGEQFGLMYGELLALIIENTTEFGALAGKEIDKLIWNALFDAKEDIIDELEKIEIADVSLADLKALIADLEAQINAVEAQLEAAKDYTGDGVDAMVDALAAEVAEAKAYLAKLNALADKVEDLVNEIENETDLTVEKVEAIIADAESIVADTQTLVDETKAALAALGVVYEEVMPKLIAALEAANGPVGEAYDVTVAEIEAFAAELQKGYETTMAAFNTAAANIDGIVAETVSAVSESVAEAVAAIETATVEAYNEIAPAVLTAIEVIEAQAQELAKSTDANVRDAAEAILAEVAKLEEIVDEAEYTAQFEAVESIVNDLIAEAQAIETSEDAELFFASAGIALGELAEIADDLYILINGDVFDALAEIDITTIVTNAAGEIGSDAYSAYIISAAAIEDAVDVVVPAVQNAVSAYESAVVTAAGEIAQAVTDAATAIGDEVVVVIDTASAAVDSIVAQGDSSIRNIIDAWSGIYDAATKAELDVNCTTTYAALGNAAAYAEKLGIPAAEELDDADLVIIGMDTTEMMAEIEEYLYALVAETIANDSSDIKTLLADGVMGYDVMEILKDTIGLELDLSATTEEADWSVYSIDEAVVEAVLAEVESTLIENDVPAMYALDLAPIVLDAMSDMDMEMSELDAKLLEGAISALDLTMELPVAALVTEAAEHVMYAYAGHAAKFAEYFEQAPADAQIVLVGTYNTMDDIFGISIGEYMDYAFAAMDIQPLAYALVNDNTTFVSVKDTDGTADGIAAAVLSALTFNGDLEHDYEWKHDEQKHWQVCANDPTHVTESAAHEYDNDSDAICNVCGYERTIQQGGSSSGGGGGGFVNPFTDVNPSDYFYKAVMWAVQKGVTAGTSKTTFSPHMECTRGQIVTFLWRAAGSPAAKNAVNPFTDVNSSDYYYNAVMWAVENGVTAGTSATTFSPDMVCTRAQIMTFLWRAQGSKAVSGVNPFVDVATDTYYEDAVQWAVKNDVTAGTGANTFSPDAECTRAQAVTFLWKCYK